MFSLCFQLPIKDTLFLPLFLYCKVQQLGMPPQHVKVPHPLMRLPQILHLILPPLLLILLVSLPLSSLNLFLFQVRSINLHVTLLQLLLTREIVALLRESAMSAFLFLFLLALLAYLLSKNKKLPHQLGEFLPCFRVCVT